MTILESAQGVGSFGALELARSLSGVADLAHPALAEHHRLTAYISGRIGAQMGLDPASIDRLVLAAMLHDIGALTLGERLAALELDFEDEEHAVPGALLLVDYRPFAEAAQIVRFHHERWDDGAGRVSIDGIEVPTESHVLFLADRIAVVAAGDGDALERRDRALDAVRQRTGSAFWPEAVDAFERVAAEEAMWFDVDAIRRGEQPGREPGLGSTAFGRTAVSFEAQDVERFARSMSRIIDFKSRFTSTHSAGVAAVAEALGAVTGADDRGRYRLRVGGLLHDVGKLSVPAEILEKTEPLSAHERHVIESHPYFSHRVLEAIADHEDLTFAALHHERPDGHGYPFRLAGDEVGWEARLMAVADVFTALTEDRPYRAGLGDGCRTVISEMVDVGHLDERAVQALFDTQREIAAVREEAQEQAAEDFEAFTLLCETSSDEGWRPPVPMA